MALGRMLNPNTAGLTNVTTVDEFSTYTARLELRRGRRNGWEYVWLRLTVLRVEINEHPGSPASICRLVTPAGTVQNVEAYVNLQERVGSQGWTPAIGLRPVVSPTQQVTMHGTSVTRQQSKNTRA